MISLATHHFETLSKIHILIYLKLKQIKYVNDISRKRSHKRSTRRQKRSKMIISHIWYDNPIIFLSRQYLFWAKKSTYTTSCVLFFNWKWPRHCWQMRELICGDDTSIRPGLGTSFPPEIGWASVILTRNIHGTSFTFFTFYWRNQQNIKI